MTLQECYQKMDGDYVDVLQRLRKEERIERFVLKFLEDESFPTLCKAREAGNHMEVFRAVHMLKGVSQNLGFSRLYLASHEMTEAVRDGKPLENEALFETVEEAYFHTMNIIQVYKELLPV